MVICSAVLSQCIGVLIAVLLWLKLRSNIKDKKSPAIDVRFPVLDEATFVARCRHSHEGSGDGQISVPIWTTTPWTLPANQAVALHPELDYALVQAKTEHGVERLLIAEALLTDVLVRYGIDDYRVVAYCKGDELEGIKLHHPFYDREVPIVLGEHVTVDAGTGAVHTAPGHGQDDYVIGKKYNLPIDNPVGDNVAFCRILLCLLESMFIQQMLKLLRL